MLKKPKVDAVPLKAYFVQGKLFELGKTTAQVDGAQLLIYDRERTICDCFKYRAKMDNELFNKAMNAYAADDHKNLGRLSAYAEEMESFLPEDRHKDGRFRYGAEDDKRVFDRAVHSGNSVQRIYKILVSQR